VAETLKTWLIAITEPTIVVIDAIAYLIIVIGVARLLVGALRAALGGLPGQEKRAVWLGFAQVLVAALSFQLAADVIETSISTSWEAIARLGAIAVIRTFLDYFLGRDVSEIRERQQDRRASAK
jgi:uncharacterized membrane protein